MKKLLFGLLCLFLGIAAVISALPVQGAETAGANLGNTLQNTPSPAVLARLQLPPYSIIFSTFSGSGTTVDGFPYEISISEDRFLVSGDRYATLFWLPETPVVKAPAVSSWALAGMVVLLAGCIALGLTRRKPKSF